jgi:succinoglycan biosynthesis protein ExoO
MTVKVSVLIAAHEAAAFVQRSIVSARRQSLACLEVIVVDDASGDGTFAAAQRAAAGDPRVRVLRLDANAGPGGARNAALAQAVGDWVAVLDADDAMAPDRLARLVAFAEREGCDIVADNLVVAPENDPEAPGQALLRSVPSGAITLARFIADNMLFEDAPCTGYLKPLFRRDFLRRYGLCYDVQTRIGEDYLLVAEALACGAVFKLMPETGYRYTRRQGSVSHRARPAHMERLLAADEAFRVRYAGSLTPTVEAALARRRRSIEDALAYLRMLEAIKSGAGAAALREMVRRPAAWRHFRMPVRDLLAGWAGGLFPGHRAGKV